VDGIGEVHAEVTVGVAEDEERLRGQQNGLWRRDDAVGEVAHFKEVADLKRRLQKDLRVSVLVSRRMYGIASMPLVRGGTIGGRMEGHVSQSQ
jgi:hypothetical protein